MNTKMIRVSLCVASVTAAFGAAVPASASVVYWTDWTSFTASSPTNSNTGSANGTITAGASSADVTYVGQVTNNTSVNNAASSPWLPAGSFSGGTVDNAPNFPDIIGLNGGSDPLIQGTINFSQAVTDPVIAIWSLGSSQALAGFDFTNLLTPVCEGGGASAQYGGSAISCSSNIVSGGEGNGVVQFNGTFNTLSWTNPQNENWYGFTVGVSDVTARETPIPAPQTFALVALGLAAMGALRRRTA